MTSKEAGMIPAEALKAAADAMQQFALNEDRNDEHTWADYARLALSAAAPFIIEALAAQAEDEYKHLPRGAAKREAGLASDWLRARAVTERGGE